jgi:PPM family protein phosphatase
MVALSLRRKLVQRSPSAGLSLVSIRGATLSDRGQVREGNEDSVYLEPADSPEARARGIICMVADGMGGYAAGEVASGMAIRIVRDRYYAGASTYIVDALRDAVEAGNLEIWEHAQSHTETTSMGCTLTAAVILGDDMVVGHVGDSRAYLIRNNEIAQLTKDHSWVEGQVDLGALTREQANQHPQRNVILRALGAHSAVEVDIVQHKIAAGDVILLCSDGLSTMVSDEEMGHLITHSGPDQIVKWLVTLANERGAPDNVTVAALQVHGPELKQFAPIRRQKWWLLAAALGLVLTLASTIGLSVVNQKSSRTDATAADPINPVASAPQQAAAPSPSRVAETPPPEGVLAAASGDVLYVLSNANLRVGPHVSGEQSSVLEMLAAGQALIVDGVELRGPIPAGSTNAVWYEVHVPGRNLSGWVWAGNVQRGVTPVTSMSPEVTASVTPVR